MKEIITALILAAIVAACTTTTKVRVQTPNGGNYELDRTLEMDGRS